MIEIPKVSMNVINSFFSNKKDVVYRYIATEIRKNIKTDIPVVKLFAFSNTGIVTAVKRDDFEKVLTEAMQFFSNIEDYNYANFCRKTIDQLKIEKFLRSMEDHF